MPSTFINSFDAMEPLVRRMLEATKKHGCCPEIVLKDTGVYSDARATLARSFSRTSPEF